MGPSELEYILKDLMIDTESRIVRRGDAVIELPNLSFDVFVSLVQSAPAPLSAEELSSAAWRSNHVSDETIAQRIALLRKALGDNPKNPAYIRTVRGAGYAIAGRVEQSMSCPTEETEKVALRTRSLALATVAIACLISVGLFWAQDGDGSRSPTIAAATDQEIDNQDLIERAREQLALHQSVETERAIEMLREALLNDPNNVEARLTLSFALSTKATKFGGDIEHKREAEALARGIIEENPNNSNAWSALGYSLGSQGRIDESLSALLYAYQLDPYNAPAGSSAAHALLLQGDLYQALDLEFRVREAGGRSRYAEIQIAQSLELIDHSAADNWYSRALSLNPGQVVILSAIARSQLRNGRPSDALETLRQAQGQDESAPSILQLRGRANVALGRIEEARHHFLAAGWRGSYELAALDAMEGNPSLAEEALTQEKLAELDHDPDPEFRILLAEVASASGESEMAIGLIAQAVNLGWRDDEWLRKSPFLGMLMQTPEGRELESQIIRQIEIQRRLTEGDVKLARAIRN